jgi:hypothetical protein
VPVQLVFPHSRLLSVRVRALWTGPNRADGPAR